jgi:hypothetical protein
MKPLLIESFVPRVTRAQQEALQFGGSQGAKQTRGVHITLWPCHLHSKVF